jgi:hypothetical protein
VPEGREALAAVGEPEVQRMATERPWRRLYRRDGDTAFTTPPSAGMSR